MSIRLAQQKDLLAITTIYNQAIEKGTCTADTSYFTSQERQVFFDAHQSNNYPLYVYEKQGQVVGYIYLSPYRPGRKAMEKTAEISYYIHNDFKRQGIGTEMMTFAIKKAKTLHLTTLIAILLSVNEGSIALLNKFNFMEWGRLPTIAEFDYGQCDHLYLGLKL